MTIIRWINQRSETIRDNQRAQILRKSMRQE